MLRVDISQAKPGMTLAMPVANPQIPTRVLLRRGYELTRETISKLHELRIHRLWVRYPNLDFLRDFLDVETLEKQNELVSAISTTFSQAQSESAARVQYGRYTKSIGELVQHLIRHPQSAMFMGDLSEADESLMAHSANVTYLALLMGLKREGYLVRERPHIHPIRAKEVINLGIGAMLHDVGVTMLSQDVRARYAETGNDRDPEWQEHPAYGYRMVHGKVPPSAAAVVLHHHQRVDGSGYAGKDYPVLMGRHIHVFARIAAVADQFDRLRHPPHMPTQPTVYALGAMLMEPHASRFDPEILGALLAVVPPYAPGSMLRLNDGRWAVAIDHNPRHPCRPRVQILPGPDPTDCGDDEEPGEEIDLSELNSRLHVAECDGEVVADLNFGTERLPENVAA